MKRYIRPELFARGHVGQIGMFFESLGSHAVLGARVVPFLLRPEPPTLVCCARLFLALPLLRLTLSTFRIRLSTCALLLVPRFGVFGSTTTWSCKTSTNAPPLHATTQRTHPLLVQDRTHQLPLPAAQRLSKQTRRTDGAHSAPMHRATKRKQRSNLTRKVSVTPSGAMVPPCGAETIPPSSR